MRFFILIFVLLASYNAMAAQPPVCLEIFKQQAPAFEDTAWDEHFDTRMLTLYDENGNIIGSTEYNIGETTSLAADHTTLSAYTLIEAPYRTQARLEQVIRKLIDLYPETQFIVTELPADQVPAYEKAWNKAENDREAFMQTQLYKVYSKLGFTDILTITDDLKGNINVILAKPSLIQRNIPHPKPPRYWDVVVS